MRFFDDATQKKVYESGFKLLVNTNELLTTDTTISILIGLEEQINTIIDILEHQLKPQLSINEKQILYGLRGDLNKIKENGLDIILIKNLNTALEELEKPDYLACSMISARATLWMVEQIKARTNKDEDKAEKLEELGVITKGEISKQTYKSFLEAVHSARHFVLHDIGYFPDYTDANNFFSSSIKMAKLYLNYKKTVEKKDNINSVQSTETS